MDNIPNGKGFTILEGLNAYAILEDSETAPEARERLRATVVTPAVVQRINRQLGVSHDAEFYVNFLMEAWINAARADEANKAAKAVQANRWV